MISEDIITQIDNSVTVICFLMVFSSPLKPVVTTQGNLPTISTEVQWSLSAELVKKGEKLDSENRASALVQVPMILSNEI